MQGHAPVGFAQYRIEHQGLQHRRFQIVGHDAPRDTPKALEGAPVQRQPGGDLLVKNQFGVLMPTVAQRSHKGIGRAQPTTDRVEQPADAAKVNL